MSTPATLLIVAGISGGGKSTAIKTFEDLGFYCVDNLPAELLPAVIRTIGSEYGQKLAIGIDQHHYRDLAHLPEWLSALGAMGLVPQLIFFDADDAILIRRYADTRRRHPLTSPGCALPDAIALEREMMRPLRARSDLIIDTSALNVHQLRRKLITELGLSQDNTLSLLFESFAYRNGVPSDADFVFDARGLPNPHWDPALRPLSGRDEPVADYFRAQPETGEFLIQVSTLLDTWLPRLQVDTRNYAIIAFGCTGGRHRSVYMAEILAEHARGKGWPDVSILHRELG